MKGLRDMFYPIVTIFILFEVISAQDCKIFCHLQNVNGTCEKQDLVSFNETVNDQFCVELCDDINCAAVALETAKATRWCCIFTSDNITYHHGKNLLYHSMGITVSRQDKKASNGNLKYNI